MQFNTWANGTGDKESMEMELEVPERDSSCVGFEININVCI